MNEHEGSDSSVDRLARARGCMLGLAIGDAFGAPVEFMSRRRILEQYGPEGIRDFWPRRGAEAGWYTDDAQMSVATARGFLDWQGQSGWKPGAGEPDLDALSLAIWERYREWAGSDEIAWAAPGNTCMSALAGDPGTPRHRVNKGSKGCGGVMRVAPFGLVGFGDRAYDAAARAAMLTHGHPTSDAASGFLALLVDRLVQEEPLRGAVASARAFTAKFEGSEEVLDAVDTATDLAGADVEAYTAIGQIGHVGEETPDGGGKGWVAEETLGIAVFCALRFEDDFHAALCATVNIGGDSDSTGCVTGAILGAAKGLAAIPRHFVEDVQNSAMLMSLADQLWEAAA